jgi:PilZ domain
MEPRYKKRIPLMASVSFCNGELSGQGCVLDLTAPGCLIESSQEVVKGQYFQLQISLPDQNALSVKLAAVRWSKGRRFGVEFIKMDEPEQQMLEALVAERPSSNLNGHEG